MPELPPFHPSVSVFHFSSKVSNAKIAKYKMATERGMVHAHEAAPPSTTNGTAGRGDSEMADQGPTKRLKLRLNVREKLSPASESTTAPIRASTTRPSPERKRSHDAAFSSRTTGTTAASPQVIDEDSTSDLSSCDSDMLRQAAKDAASPSGSLSSDADKEQYGDFLNYYVVDDGPTEAPTAKKPKVHTKNTNKTQTTTKPKATQQQRPPQAQQHLPQPTHRRQAAPILAPVAIDIRVRPPDPMRIMIMKIEALSKALNEFGGITPRPQSPQPEDAEDHTVDDFLSFFGTAPSKKSIDGPDSWSDLAHPGERDLPLQYGIEFIMNALKCWAESRVAVMRAHQHQEAQAIIARREAAKAAGLDIVPAEPMPDLSPIDLFKTPEGRAIAAFRAVVECGCVQVNAVIPSKIANAIRYLYMQIDGLINQTGAQPPAQPWRCLSYAAQIEANTVRVQKWKEAQEKAQQEMIRQQQISHQQTMRQLGLPDHLTSTMFYHHGQDEDNIELREGANVNDLVRLPVQPEPPASASPPAQIKPAPALPQQTTSASTQSYATPITSAFLSRSGQSMKFSFAPTNTEALKVFGAQAFPAVSTMPARAVSTQPVVKVQPKIEKPDSSPVVVVPGFRAINN